MYKVLLFLICLFFTACQSNKKLPILGEPSVQNGELVYPTVSDFHVINQDSADISLKDFKGKIYLADFIFLSCPTICPKMTQTMSSVYQYYQSNSQIAYISYSIDPLHDTIPRLKEYANQLNISNQAWHIVTGNKDSIMYLAEHAYFSTAFADSTSPGGFTHSGGILLVDKNKHIRGVYDGTATVSSQKIIADIKLLLDEQN